VSREVCRVQPQPARQGCQCPGRAGSFYGLLPLQSIEGHDIHPVGIERALQNDDSDELLKPAQFESVRLIMINTL
jgi:hypothetical protein